MNRRELALLACAAAAACARRYDVLGPDAALPQPPPMPSAPLDDDVVLSHIGFGSCYVPQFEESDVWRAILASRPDVFLFIGDNVYQSEENGRPELRELREAYTMLAADAPFAAVRAATPVLVTWDDHDYGMNDAGAEFPARLQTEALFKHVWAVGADDPRSTRPGVYYHRSAGPAGRRTQLIVLDTRYFRTPQTMLGDAQWAWLDDVLREEADARVLASSVPVLTESDQGESWRSWPAERERLLAMLERAGGAVIISGDSHFGAFYRRDEGVAYPMLELTSSSLNFPRTGAAAIPPGPADPARLAPVFFAANFGAIYIDWANRAVSLVLNDATGPEVRRETIALAALRS